MIWAKILLVVFYLFQRQYVIGLQHCCPKNVSLNLDLHYMCDNSEQPLASCDRIPLQSTRYIIQNGTNEEYLNISVTGLIVHSPNFCIGQREHEGSVALYCPTNVMNFTEALEEYEELSSSEEILEYFTVAVRSLDFLSCLFMAFMAAAWFLMLSAEEMEQKLLFHFSSSLSLAHAFYFYDFVSSNGSLPRFCYMLYLTFFFLLSTFIWFLILIYYLWKKIKFNSNSSIIIQHYRIIGYGVPTLLIISGNIHTFIRKIFSNSNLVLGCSTFRHVIEDFYVHPFLIITALVIIFLWYNLRRHMKNTVIITSENELAELKMNKLLELTGRLLVVLALPWLLLILCDFTNEFTLFRYDFLLYTSSFLDFATSGDGIFVSIIMISSHPQLKLWIFQNVCCFIRLKWFRNNVFKGKQEFSASTSIDHVQLESSP